MPRSLIFLFGSLACGLISSLPNIAFAADLFDRHTADVLKHVFEAGKPVEKLSMLETARIKPVSANISTPCVIIRTDEGNWTKALIAWGFKKGADKPTPVLLIERFVTYRGDRPDLTAAVGKDMMLFAGFGFNFDIGQVVPEGHGADIELTADGQFLKVRGEAQLVPLQGSAITPPEKGTKPNPKDHDGVLATDFIGTWKVNADGRWLGEMEIHLTETGRASGLFTSDDSKSTYEMGGQIGGVPHNLKMEIQFANALMSLDGYLWTKDKSTMAGTVTLANRKFGFYATRVEE